MAQPEGVLVLPVTGLGEVTPGTDVARLVAEAVAPARPDGPELCDGDVLVVTQKIVSKAEGRLVAIDHGDSAAKLALVTQESVRILRRRGDLVISETRHGFVCANAGVDLSNVADGTAALLPDDPDRSARRIRAGLANALGDRRRGHRLGHLRPPVAAGRDRRRHRLRRGGRRGRSAGHARCGRAGARRHRGLRGGRTGSRGRARDGQGPRRPRRRRAGGAARLAAPGLGARPRSSGPRTKTSFAESFSRAARPRTRARRASRRPARSRAATRAGSQPARCRGSSAAAHPGVPAP